MLLLVLVALVVISSKTVGKTSVIASVTAGLIMVSVAVYYIFWIIKTPVKKEPDEIA